MQIVFTLKRPKFVEGRRKFAKGTLKGPKFLEGRRKFAKDKEACGGEAGNDGRKRRRGRKKNN